MIKAINILFLFSVVLLLLSCGSEKQKVSVLPEKATLSATALMDKIKGGWAGQTVGCTFGGPTEFKFKGTMIQDHKQVLWYDDYIKDIFESDPGLYDDVYMDLTFEHFV